MENNSEDDTFERLCKGTYEEALNSFQTGMKPIDGKFEGWWFHELSDEYRKRNNIT